MTEEQKKHLVELKLIEIAKKSENATLPEQELMTKILFSELRHRSKTTAEILQSLDAIFAYGMDANVRDQAGHTPIFFASGYDALEIGNYLLEKGAIPELRNNYGKTPLMRYAEFGREEIAWRVIRLGADIHAKDNNGDTVRDFAQLNHQAKFIKNVIEPREIELAQAELDGIAKSENNDINII